MDGVKGQASEPLPEENPAIGLPRPSKTLTALTTSALALPGIAGSARADAPIDRATASAAYSYYREDNLAPGKWDDSQGSRERYEVHTVQGRFDMPTSERTDIGIDFLFEDMSGASPWFVTADADRGGRPVQVMSGATIDDQRFDVLADIDFYLDNGKDTLSAGFSIEKDYTSFNVGIGTERNFNDKNTVISLSGAFSYDWIEPTDADDFPTIRPDDENKWSVDLFAGVSQILTRASTMAITVNYKHSADYVSDPYKAVASLDPNAGLVSDERGDSKDQVSFLFRYRHHIEDIAASAHADYRFYVDDWGIVSHTAEVAWYQSLFEIFTITPSLRYYSQSKADFYEPILAAGSLPSERSSDFRVSPYGAFSWKLKAEWEIREAFRSRPGGWAEALGFTGETDLLLALSYERYISDGAFALTSVTESDEAPGLVDFRVFAVTLNGRF